MFTIEGSEFLLSRLLDEGIFLSSGFKKETCINRKKKEVSYSGYLLEDLGRRTEEDFGSVDMSSPKVVVLRPNLGPTRWTIGTLKPVQVLGETRSQNSRLFTPLSSRDR